MSIFDGSTEMQRRAAQLDDHIWRTLWRAFEDVGIDGSLSALREIREDVKRWAKTSPLPTKQFADQLCDAIRELGPPRLPLKRPCMGHVAPVCTKGGAR